MLGVRIGLHATALLDLEVPRDDKRLLVVVETDGCFADGVAAATGRTVQVRPHPQARERAWRYAPGAPDRWHAQLADDRGMPAGELLRARAVALALSLDTLLGRPGRRVTCALRRGGAQRA